MSTLSKARGHWRQFRYGQNVASHPYRQPEYVDQDVDSWIREGIAGYQQWYQHVDFGQGVEAHVTSPPDWMPDPSLDVGSGMDRWDYIIARNIPDVAGMRVLDLGCNVGLYSLELARLGAVEVVGVDRDLEIRQRTGQLPRVDLVSQAEFVRKAFELREGRTFPITYQAIDFQDLAAIENLGRFDLILALNVVYHELERAPKLVETLGTMTNRLVLQSSLGHPEPIRGWASLARTVDMLTAAGFTKVVIDSPEGYLQPVIQGVRSSDGALPLWV